MKMPLVSTRDSNEVQISYADALLAGLAPDGGLYTPLVIPKIDQEALKKMSGLPYPDLFTRVKSLFVGDSIASEVQRDLASAAFTQDKFRSVRGGNYVPVTEIQPGFYVQNLSLGPTAAFKDYALQPLAQDMNHILSVRDQQVRLLGATSGDTGSAAEAAVKGLDRISLCMLSPMNGMSQFQRAQMGQLSGGNIHNLSVNGRFDDCQDIVKAIKSDPEFADLGAVNSINWGRIASQIPYYVSGYLQVMKDAIGGPVDFVVPTGNFGNVLAGYYARKMGVPIRNLIVATNENDVLHRLITTGVYAAQSAMVTSSPSMDISKASNYERLVYYLTDQNPAKTAEYMRQFAQNGSVSFTDIGLPSNALELAGFVSGRSTHVDRIRTIKWAHETADIIVDPHTADGIKVARDCKEDGVPIVSMVTALPVKFESTIKEALGFIPKRDTWFEGLEQQVSGLFTDVDANSDDIKKYIRGNLYTV